MRSVLMKPSVVGITIFLKARQKNFYFQDKKLFMAIKRAFLVCACMFFKLLDEKQL